MLTVPSRAGGAIPRPVLFALAALMGLTMAFSISPARADQWQDDDDPPPKLGRASYYGYGFAGRRTASGDVFRPEDLTAAHRFLPLGTKVRVTNLNNGRSVLVTINDRGPVPHSRIIDLSYGAAQMLGCRAHGLEPVRLDVIPQQDAVVAENFSRSPLGGRAP